MKEDDYVLKLDTSKLIQMKLVEGAWERNLGKESFVCDHDWLRVEGI